MRVLIVTMRLILCAAWVIVPAASLAQDEGVGPFGSCGVAGSNLEAVDVQFALSGVPLTEVELDFLERARASPRPARKTREGEGRSA